MLNQLTVVPVRQNYTSESQTGDVIERAGDSMPSSLKNLWPTIFFWNCVCAAIEKQSFVCFCF